MRYRCVHVSRVRDRIVIDTVERHVNRSESTAARNKWKVRLHAEERRRVPYQQTQGIGIAAIQRHAENLLLFDDLP